MLAAETLHLIAKDVPRMGWAAEDARIPLLFELVQLQTPKLPSYNQGLCYICAFALGNSLELERMFLNSRASVSAVETCALVIDRLLFDQRLCLLLDPKSCFLQQYVDNFDSLFCTYLPDLYRKFGEFGFDCVYFSLDWFTTFFTNALDKDNCLLVWDLVLGSGAIGDGFYIAGLALLKVIANTKPVLNSDELFMNFKQWTRSGIDHKLFAEEILWFTNALTPRVFAKEHSTIKMLERRVSDPNDILVQLPFDATFFMRAIQAGDGHRVGVELVKYAFPAPLLEYALYRSCLLGHTACVSLLVSRFNSPFPDLAVLLECAAMLGQAGVCQILLNRFPALLVGPTVLGIIHRLTEISSAPADAYLPVLQVLKSSAVATTTTTLTCTDCEQPITAHSRATCSRCKLDFCDKTCCNTFRQLGNKRFRTCYSCLYYWGAAPESVHFPCDLLLDASGKTRTCCECDRCLQTFSKFRARHRYAQLHRHFLFQVESLAQTALDAKTLQLWHTLTNAADKPV